MPENQDPLPIRKKEDYKKLSRVKIFNHFNTEYKKGKPGNRLSNFLSRGFWTWIYHTIKSGFGKKHPYPTYPVAASSQETVSGQGSGGGHQTSSVHQGNNGRYPLKKAPGSISEEIVIALAADWATFTPESFAISARIASHSPDYTIHMGDTYYVGALPEIKSNFFPMHRSPWVRGNVGSFAILGNHEMYTRGVAFFDTLLKSMGIRQANGKFSGQHAGFFCLENEHWIILGLDTGYHSLGIPLIELIPGLGADCRFDDLLMEWLEKTVFNDPGIKKKGILILTHHQYITAFKEKEYARPAIQLARHIGKDKPVLWLWGHEHRFSMFEKANVREGITAYGRCIGHGGMPVELNKEHTFTRCANKHGADKLVMVDTRPYPNKDNLNLGYNGYAVLKLKENRLTIEYHDINKYLLAETWTTDANGYMKGSIAVSPSSGLKPENGKTWEDAVK